MYIEKHCLRAYKAIASHQRGQSQKRFARVLPQHSTVISTTREAKKCIQIVTRAKRCANKS